MKGEFFMQIEHFGVEEWMNEFETRATYNIAETCVKSLTVSELLGLDGRCDEHIENIKDIELTYGSIPGRDDLRSEITGLYHTNKSIDNILIMNGGIGANALVLFTLIEPGDEVITVCPTYQQLYSLPLSLGAKVHKVSVRRENNYLPDLDDIRGHINSKTKVIIINTPNNPTGACFGNELMTEIAKLADSVGAWVVCDEIYRGLEHEGSYSIPSISDIYEKGIGTSSVSKVYSLAGLRLGWIAAPKNFIAQCFSHRDYTTISCGQIDEYLALVALKNKETIIKRNIDILHENKATLMKWIEEHSAFHTVEPQAGTTALIRYDYDISSEDFCRNLFDYNGTFVVPGKCFEFEKCFRMGYAPDSAILKKGLECISLYAESLCKA